MALFNLITLKRLKKKKIHDTACCSYGKFFFFLLIDFKKLCVIDTYLLVIQSSFSLWTNLAKYFNRKMSTDDKRKLSVGITSLCPDYLCKALEIVAQGNQNLQDPSEEVEIDIDAQVVHFSLL